MIKYFTYVYKTKFQKKMACMCEDNTKENLEFILFRHKVQRNRFFVA